jgi:hypothetical protein
VMGVDIYICDPLNAIAAQRQNGQYRVIQIAKPVGAIRHAVMRSASLAHGRTANAISTQRKCHQ